MTSEPPNHDISEAVEVVDAILKLVADPTVRRKLRKLMDAGKDVIRNAGSEPQPKSAPEKGTCPTCRKSYSIKKNGALRRHGKGKCYTDDQLPAEIIPAVLAIAQLGNASGEVPKWENTRKKHT